MKTCPARIAAVAAAVFACANGATGATIAYYAFTDLTTSDSFSTSKIENPTLGGGSLSIDAPGTGASSFGGGATGSTTNQIGTSSPNVALSLSVGAGLANNGKSITFDFSTLGYQDITFSYATRGPASGFTSQAFSYSVNGGAFVQNVFPSITPATTSALALASFSTSSIAAINNQLDVQFRLTFSGGTNATSTNSIDNVQIGGTSAVPLPPAAIAGAALLGVVGFLKRRRSAVVS